MKKEIVISLIALLFNSAAVFAQTLPTATEKDFTATYDASVRSDLELEMPNAFSVARPNRILT